MAKEVFVRVAAKENAEDVELPAEDDETILLTTLQANFPSGVGLKYRSSTGGWRGIKASDKALEPPLDGWGDSIYYVTESDALKRKPEDTYEGRSKSARKDLLQDIIVLGLPFSTTEEELSEYFTKQCGELAFHEIKLNRETKKSRGFGFIRFKSQEAAREALYKKHEIDGRKLEIRLSKPSNVEKALKLFVGRLKEGTTQQELKEYFSEFGDIIDLFLPVKPFRGFGFVTFASEVDGHAALRSTHILNGNRLHVTVAEPKEEKPPRNESFQGPNSFNGASNNSWNQNNRNNPQSHDTRYNPNSTRYNKSPPKSDMDNDLKSMLFKYLSSH